MAEQNLSNLHHAYMDKIRHWHPDSEPFTGGDALFTALENGWEMDKTVKYEEYWLSGIRPKTVFYITLRRDGETMTMPVITNPFVRRVVEEMHAKLVSMGEHKTVKSRR